MSNAYKKVAIYGGAFNPPHIGHAAAVETVLRLFPCDELWIMPSQSRSDKQINTTGNQRFQMLELMVKELFPEKPIVVSSFELERPSHTVTYDTFKELQSRWPDTDFHFTVTTELINDMFNWWEKGKELYHEANFIILERPGYPLKVPTPPHATALKGGAGWIEISSTRMRDLLSQGQSAIPYIPLSVAEYIKTNYLYTK